MERSDVWFIAVVCAVLGIIVGMAWVDFWNELNPLKEYQTLIAGLAAVAAAFATINTMHRTDEAQAERHRQLVDLTLRPDRLKANRAAYAFPAAIKTLAREADFIVTLATKSSDITPELVNRLIEATQSVEKRVRRVLSMNNLSGAQDIFDEKTSVVYNSLLGMMESDGLTVNLSLIDFRNSTHTKLTMRAFVAELQRFQSMLGSLAEGLERLREDLKHHRPPSSS